MFSGLKGSHLRRGFIIFTLLSLGVMGVILVWTMDADTCRHLKEFRFEFLPLLLFLCIIRWYLDGMFFVVLAKYGHRSSLSVNRAAVIRLEGTVLSVLVPVLVGTFAMHAYLLHKERFRVSESMAMTTLRAILPIFLFLVNLPILFLIRDQTNPKFFTEIVTLISLPVIVSVIFFVIALFFPIQIKRLATLLIRWFGHFKRFRHAKHRLIGIKKRVFREIDHLSRIFWMYLRERKTTLIYATFWIFLSFIVEYLAAIVILWGLGFPPPFWKAMAIQFLLRPILYLAPTPGGAGVWEFSYLGFFSLFLPHSLIGVAVLIWRMMLNHLPILVGGFFIAREFGREEDLEKVIGLEIPKGAPKRVVDGIHSRDEEIQKEAKRSPKE